MQLSDNLLKMIYGDVNIPEIRKNKKQKTIWEDVILFLANNDITKINEIKEIKIEDIMRILDSRLKSHSLKEPKVFNKIGYKK
jgi:hypothetical protein